LRQVNILLSPPLPIRGIVAASTPSLKKSHQYLISNRDMHRYYSNRFEIKQCHNLVWLVDVLCLERTWNKNLSKNHKSFSQGGPDAQVHITSYNSYKSLVGGQYQKTPSRPQNWKIMEHSYALLPGITLFQYFSDWWLGRYFFITKTGIILLTTLNRMLQYFFLFFSNPEGVHLMMYLICWTSAG